MTNIERAAGATVALALKNDNAASWTGTGLPDEASRINLAISISNGKADTSYEVHLELHGTSTAWFVDETNPGSTSPAAKLNVLGEASASISIADSEEEVVTVLAYINFGPGAGESSSTLIQVQFEDVPASIELALSNNNADADGRHPIKAIATVLTKNNNPVNDVMIYFELQDNDTSARFLAASDLEISDDGHVASGRATPNGQLSVLFTDAYAESGVISATVIGPDGKLTSSEPFSFKFPEGLTLEPVALSMVTNDGSGDWVEWDGDQRAEAAADGKAQFGVFALVRTKEGRPWQNGSILFQLDEGSGAQFARDSGITIGEDSRSATAQLDDGGTTPMIHIVSSIQEMGVMRISILNGESDAVVTKELTYEFTNPWTGLGDVQSKFPNSDDTHRYIVADGVDSVDLQVNLQLTGPRGAPLSNSMIPADAFSSAKLIAYDDLGYGYNELGSGRYAGWSYKGNESVADFKESESNCDPIANESQTNPKGEGLVGHIYTIRCYGRNNAADYKFGLDITPTGRQILSTGKIGKHGYYLAKSEPCSNIRFSESGVPLSAVQQKIITRR